MRNLTLFTTLNLLVFPVIMLCTVTQTSVFIMHCILGNSFPGPHKTPRRAVGSPWAAS